MFIYKIEVGGKVYIGFDSNPEYKETRWRAHCKAAQTTPKYKLHVEMQKHGIENCVYEVLDRGFTRMVDLALAEINYIKQYDSYRTGLNSTLGGDGMGKHNLLEMTEDEIKKLKESLGEHWTAYNIHRWGKLSAEERKLQSSHLHTDIVYQKKSETLKKFYKANPEVKKEKAIAIKKWQQENIDTVRAINQKNGMLGAAKVSKPVTVYNEGGATEVFKSRSEFQRNTGLWFTTLVEKTKQGLYYKGYKLKDDNE